MPRRKRKKAPLLVTVKPERVAARGFMRGSEVRQYLAIGRTRLWELARDGEIQRVGGAGPAARYTRLSVEHYAIRRLICGK